MDPDQLTSHPICINIVFKVEYIIVLPWVVLYVELDNPRAKASGLSYVQMDNHGITILYHINQCRPCTSRGISCF